MCFENEGALYNAPYNYSPERVCWYYWNSDPDQSFNGLDMGTDYIEDPFLKHSVEVFEGQTFYQSSLSESFDDELTLQVMGLGNTKYVNLANNIMKREMSQLDLAQATLFLKERYRAFEASWGYLVTWYKVSPFPGRLDAFNSFQCAILCNDAGVLNDPNDDACFVILDFSEIGWIVTNSDEDNPARSGFNDGNGNVVELPFSYTSEVNKLWALSNIDTAGVWVYQISQRNSSTAIIPSGKFDQLDLNALTHCKDHVKPAVVQIFKDENFVINNCVLPPHQELQILLHLGSNHTEEAYDIQYNVDKFQVTFGAKQFFSEPVPITLHVDKYELDLEKMVYFFDPNDMNLIMNITRHGGIVDASVPPDQVNSDMCVEFTERENKIWARVGKPVDIPINGTINFEYEIETDSSGVVFIRLHICGFLFSRPIKTERFDIVPSDFCHVWDQIESEKDYSACQIALLSSGYSCPRQVHVRLPGHVNVFIQKDVWWAHYEVTEGRSGWEYDICCNKKTSLRKEMDDIGYCSKVECQFNKGADVCIRSPTVTCKERNFGITYHVSNKCCYYSNGSIIPGGDKMASGSFNIQVNSLSNMIPHYLNEMRPYASCSRINQVSQGIDLYRDHRPSLIGYYYPRIVRWVRVDPHLQTLDGINYAFMGIGVYTMIESTLQNPTTMQASMRRYGNGTVFSGFVVQHLDTKLECYIDESGNFSYAINGYSLDSYGIPFYVLYDIAITRRSDGMQYKFQLTQSGFIAEVIITRNFLNLLISPPTGFSNNSLGLMGRYDGDPTNDFTTPDGIVIPSDSNWSTIHVEFGETWKVNRSDWLFSNPEILDLIGNDTELAATFVPVYTPTFSSEEEKLEAERLCKNNSACILDASLTGLDIADVYDYLETIAPDVDFLSEISLSVLNNVSNFFIESSTTAEISHLGSTSVTNLTVLPGVTTSADSAVITSVEIQSSPGLLADSGGSSTSSSSQSENLSTAKRSIESEKTTAFDNHAASTVDNTFDNSATSSPGSLTSQSYPISKTTPSVFEYDVTSESPSIVDIHATSESPSIPDIQATSESPSIPVIQATSESPSIPDIHATSESPSIPDIDATSESPANSDSDAASNSRSENHVTAYASASHALTVDHSLNPIAENTADTPNILLNNPASFPSTAAPEVEKTPKYPAGQPVSPYGSADSENESNTWLIFSVILLSIALVGLVSIFVAWKLIKRNALRAARKNVDKFNYKLTDIDINQGGQDQQYMDVSRSTDYQ